MLGLPQSTEIKKILPKKAICEKFGLKGSERTAFEKNVKQLMLVNEISPKTVSIAIGNSISSIFVLLIDLKEECEENLVKRIANLINQRMIIVLAKDEKIRLAALRKNNLLISQWQDESEIKLTLKGLTLGEVWDNLTIDVGKVLVEQGNSVDEQLAQNAIREKLAKEILDLDRRMWAEKQPKKKFALRERLNVLKKEMEELGWKN